MFYIIKAYRRVPLFSLSVSLRSIIHSWQNMREKTVLMFMLLVLLPLSTISGPHSSHLENKDAYNEYEISGRMRGTIAGTEYGVAGSTLPECGHACGGCEPCRRVMVSFKCNIADSCPVAYRCFCKGKVFPVPSARP